MECQRGKPRPASPGRYRAYQVGTLGTVAIQLNDANPFGTSSYDGDYTLYVRVERLP